MGRHRIYIKLPVLDYQLPERQQHKLYEQNKKADSLGFLDEILIEEEIVPLISDSDNQPTQPSTFAIGFAELRFAQADTQPKIAKEHVCLPPLFCRL